MDRSDHERSAVKTRLALALILALGILACSDGGESSSAPTVYSRSTSTVRAGTSTTATSTTTPPEQDLLPTMEDLVDRYNGAVAAILTDPGVAADPSHPLTAAYLTLFPPGSTFAEGALQFWANEGALGRRYRPGPRGQLAESTVVELEEPGLGEATFTICTLNSIEIVDASGSLLEAQGGQSAATVVAVEQDGAWFLRDLTQVDSSLCPSDGVDG